jgi:hypothetical protein
MKILLVGRFCWCFANISAEQVITCKKEVFDGVPGCRFSGVTIGPNENVSIKTDPKDADVNSITWVEFEESSVYSAHQRSSRNSRIWKDLMLVVKTSRKSKRTPLEMEKIYRRSIWQEMH